MEEYHSLHLLARKGRQRLSVQARLDLLSSSALTSPVTVIRLFLLVIMMLYIFIPRREGNELDIYTYTVIHCTYLLAGKEMNLRYTHIL